MIRIIILLVGILLFFLGTYYSGHAAGRSVKDDTATDVEKARETTGAVITLFLGIIIILIVIYLYYTGIQLHFPNFK